MAKCHEMKKGEIYVCEECGVELQVIKECNNIGIPAEQCKCHSGDETAGFFCCGKELVKKAS